MVLIFTLWIPYKSSVFVDIWTLIGNYFRTSMWPNYLFKLSLNQYQKFDIFQNLSSVTKKKEEKAYPEIMSRT